VTHSALFKLIATVALVLSCATRALAFGGLEISPGGARALGRAGATAARAEDGYVLLYGPAGLAALQQDGLMLNVDTVFHDMCVTPYGYYGWGVYTPGLSDFGDSAGSAYANDPLDRVCNSAKVAPLPGITYTLKLNEDLGLGFGMLAPAGLPGLQYGGPDGTLATPDGARPTPTRYQLVEQKVTFALGPSIGVGYAVLPGLRLGATFTWIAVASEISVVQAYQNGTSPDTDMFVKIAAHDYFVPSVGVSMLATPFDFLDLAVFARVIEDFSGSGEITVTTNTYQQSGASGYRAYENDPVGLSSATTGLPWIAVLAARYSQPLPNAPRGKGGERLRGDPLSQEQFDVELDVAYQVNTRTSESHISFDPGEIVFRRDDGTVDDENYRPIELPDPNVNDFSSSKHAKNAMVVRLGGTYNVLPGTLGVSAGSTYETRGVDASYASIDTFAFSRVGVGLGVVARVSDLDFAIAYGHVFQETLIVAPPDHENFRQTTTDPTSGFDKRVEIDSTGGGGHVKREQNPPKRSEIDATAKLPQPVVLDFEKKHPRIVNAGVYEASFDVLSLQVGYRF
jgi:hypothetical protein